MKALAVSGDFLFSGSADTTIRVWSIATKELITTLTGHTNWVMALAVSGDFLFSGSIDKTIRVWKARLPNNILSFGHQEL